jgi:hypothetical protein
MVTRMSLVVKKVIFSPQKGDENGSQNGDENQSRRQKMKFFASKR